MIIIVNGIGAVLVSEIYGLHDIRKYILLQLLDVPVHYGLLRLYCEQKAHNQTVFISCIDNIVKHYLRPL